MSDIEYFYMITMRYRPHHPFSSAEMADVTETFDGTITVGPGETVKENYDYILGMVRGETKHEMDDRIKPQVLSFVLMPNVMEPPLMAVEAENSIQTGIAETIRCFGDQGMYSSREVQAAIASCANIAENWTSS